MAVYHYEYLPSQKNANSIIVFTHYFYISTIIISLKKCSICFNLSLFVTVLLQNSAAGLCVKS